MSNRLVFRVPLRFFLFATCVTSVVQMFLYGVDSEMASIEAMEVDKVLPSRHHPGIEQFPVEHVPMFICLGFDDNGVADVENNGGASWIRNYLKDRRNPEGLGNLATYDGSLMRASFYMTAKYCREDVYESKEAIRKVWKQLYHDGHEIGNHSTVHLMEWDDVNQRAINYNGKSYSTEDWIEKEILPCQEWLTSEVIGVDAKDIKGWRSPRLEWNANLFPALVKHGFLYDCSIESDFENDGTSVYWPFTLDEGHPLQSDVPVVKGFWEMPAYAFHIPQALRGKTANEASVTGLDYNVWIKKEWGGYELTGPEFTDILIYTLDQRMAGNRAPMLIGLHSDIYTDLHGKNEEYCGTKSARERQLAIEDFIEYAIHTYPDAVRIVPTIAVIEWMRNPQPLHVVE